MDAAHVRRTLGVWDQVASNRRACLARLSKAMGPTLVQEAQACGLRLLAELGRDRPIASRRVMLAYGGGKDSTFLTAFVRYIQLSLWDTLGQTFMLRIITNRHAAMSHAVMRNIDRAYIALGVYHDPDVQPILVHGNETMRFNVDAPLPRIVMEKNREDILMNGHKFRSDARPTFCNACNIAMLNAFGLGIAYDGGADVVITGDSPFERKSYYKWVRGLARSLNIEPIDHRQRFRGFLKAVDGIAKYYFGEVYGSSEDPAAMDRVHWDIPSDPSFFSVYADTNYEAGAHWELLVGFLGFEFDDMMFSFSESDCGNPSIMAHIRGLRSETLLSRTYEEGIREYVSFGLWLMSEKEFPEPLMEMMRQRFSSDEAIRRFRSEVSDYASRTFSVSTSQLVCMIYSPFIDQAERLEEWVRREQPHFLRTLPDIRRALEGAPVHAYLENALKESSGLSLDHLRRLHRTSSVPNLSQSSAQLVPLTAILRHDPHKRLIETASPMASGKVVEYISGR